MTVTGRARRPARRFRTTGALVIVGALLGSLVAIGAFAGGRQEGGRYTIMTLSNSRLGSYLTDGRGNTLYYSTNDIPGLSNCSGGCLKTWPPFSAASITVPPSLDAKDFGYIRRDNGRKQTTYKGWPLYYYSRDWAPRDTNGQGLYGAWYVVQPALFGPPAS